ncbi:hypothetical protein [Streptomyces sp. TP-A0356]|uniref:hypothetical protein n=1 Tax=Streptomyces sp. TP-A0356 TaxID=1359208 RepID=UPI000A89166A|nr:hypothetical protein [Streptomyces sp. TP-A0356]
MRPCGPEDLDTVPAFWKAAAEGTSISDARDGGERLLSRDPEALILAERDGELVGTVIAGFDGRRCRGTRLRGPVAPPGEAPRVPPHRSTLLILYHGGVKSFLRGVNSSDHGKV